jgi:hypothetical protein
MNLKQRFSVDHLGGIKPGDPAFPLHHLLRYLTDIAIQLDFKHLEKVHEDVTLRVHGDVTPEKILFNDYDKAYVKDAEKGYGATDAVTERTLDSLRFTSPEFSSGIDFNKSQTREPGKDQRGAGPVVRQYRLIDGLADQFSLAMVYYYIRTGGYPRSGYLTNDIPSICAAIETDDPPPNWPFWMREPERKVLRKAFEKCLRDAEGRLVKVTNSKGEERDPRFANCREFVRKLELATSYEVFYSKTAERLEQINSRLEKKNAQELASFALLVHSVAAASKDKDNLDLTNQKLRRRFRTSLAFSACLATLLLGGAIAACWTFLAQERRLHRVDQSLTEVLRNRSDVESRIVWKWKFEFAPLWSDLGIAGWRFGDDVEFRSDGAVLRNGSQTGSWRADGATLSVHLNVLGSWRNLGAQDANVIVFSVTLSPDGNRFVALQSDGYLQRGVRVK